MNNYSKTRKTLRKIYRKSVRIIAKTLLCFFIVLLLIFIVTSIRIFYYAHSDVTNPRFTDGKLEVIMFDVGQGNSCLLLQNDKAMLIDSGRLLDWNLVDNYLDDLGVRKLDYLVITHPHQDHAGGIFSLLDSIHIDKVIMPEMKNENWNSRDTAFLSLYDFYVGWANILSGKNLIMYEGSVSKSLFFSNSTVSIISHHSDSQNFNNNSLVLKVNYGDVSILFTGDIEYEVEQELIASGVDLSSDVYMAAHHGSKTSNTSAFLDVVNPSYVMISSDNGNDNLYGHPVKRFMNYLKEHQILVFRTDESGTVVLTTDGTNIEFDTDPDDYKSGKELLLERTSEE